MEFLLLNLTTIIFAAIVFCTSFYFLSSNSKSGRQKLPPKAGGGWPILGHLHIFSSQNELPHVALGALADEYGPAFTIRLGVRRVLVVSTWKLVKELCTSHDVHISTRPMFRAAKHLGYDYEMFSFSPYGPYWRELRKLASLGLLSSRRLEQLKHIRVGEIETAIKELYKQWSEKKSSGGSSAGSILVEMKQWFGEVTLNVMLQMVVGKRCFGTAESGDEEEGRRCLRILRLFFQYLGVFVPADALPFLGILDIGGHEKAMKKLAKELDSLVDDWLQERRRKKAAATGDGSTAGDEQYDFMGAMLSLLEGKDLHGHYAETVTKSSCLSLLSGGADTIMVMLTWILSLMMNNLHVLKKVQEELDMVVGKSRMVNESDINSLIYLQAVVKEVMRLYPAAPIGAPRLFTKDCIISGFHVPKGTWLFFNIWKLQRDPQVWSDPLDFKPERFLNSHKNVDVMGRDFELIPFGVGRRICPGSTFAVQMLHLVLAKLLHSFELSTVNNEEIDMSESSGLSNLKVTPLEILIAPRLPAYIY